ncbi:hypothetical protein DY000_02006205 [Brassica cretica]|uniref:Uncharacterized protein n=1 Tax=Brassica cretica TaxID=69181 RepID=A0ABQ7BY13_BRACR|nr:hypothetical protein DY000_02006205 [Brassica cretica]
MWESGVSPLDHEIVSGQGDHVGTRRSYLDPEVIWEPGGSSLDPDILFGTRRLSTDPEVVWEPEGRFEPGGFSGPGGRLGTQRFLQDPEVVLNPKVSFGPEGRFEPGGFSRPGGRFEPEGCSGPGGLEMFSGPGDCMGTRRKSLTGLEGVMTQVPGFAAFHVWKSRGWMQDSEPELLSTGTWRPVGITCALKSTGVAHSQRTSPGQDISLVILLSQDLGCIPLDVKAYSWGSRPEVVLSWLAQDMMEKRSMLHWASTSACRWQVPWAWREHDVARKSPFLDPGLACQWMARLVGLAGEDHLYMLKSAIGSSRVKTAIFLISSSGGTRPFVEGWRPILCRTTLGYRLSGTLSWSQVFLFCHLGYIFSKSGDCGNILLRSGGSGIYPPETWRFVGLVPRNLEFVELILLEPEGFGVDPSETWRFPDAGELLCEATVLLRPWAWRACVDMISCDCVPRLVYRQELTWVWSRNRLTYLPLLSTWSRPPLEILKGTWPWLPLEVYQGILPEKAVLRRSELAFRGVIGFELLARRRSSSVPGAWAGFPALGQGSFRETTPVEFDKYSKALYPPSYQEFVKVVNPAGRYCAMLEDLSSFSYVAEL